MLLLAGLIGVSASVGIRIAEMVMFGVTLASIATLLALSGGLAMTLVSIGVTTIRELVVRFGVVKAGVW